MSYQSSFSALSPLALSLSLRSIVRHGLPLPTVLWLYGRRRLLHRLPTHLLWHLVPVKFFPCANDDFEGDGLDVRSR